MPFFGNNSGDDPLGIAVQGRAQAARQTQHLQDWGHPSFGPLPDPKWDGLFQAMGEQGVTGVADNSVGAKRGMWNPQIGGVHPSQNRMPGSPQMLQGYGAPTGNLPGYGAPDQRSRIINGLQSAYQGTR